MNKAPKCCYELSVNMVNIKYKNDKINDTTPVKLKQKPCHIKIAHLSEGCINSKQLKVINSKVKLKVTDGDIDIIRDQQ